MFDYSPDFFLLSDNEVAAVRPVDYHLGVDSTMLYKAST
jgi:hypothetical protein